MTNLYSLLKSWDITLLTSDMLVAQLCPALCNPMGCSLPVSSVHGILQAEILCVAIPFSRGSSKPRDWTQVSCIAGRFFTNWATREAQLTKVYVVKAMVFPVVVYGCESSSSHVWIWEVDEKESWALKNWCFWTVVLEKILESPLDSKEIQPVHPKGNQSRTFIGRTDAEAETLILWSPDSKNWLIGKDLDAGKDWRQEEKGTTEDEMIG